MAFDFEKLIVYQKSREGSMLERIKFRLAADLTSYHPGLLPRVDIAYCTTRRWPTSSSLIRFKEAPDDLRS